jgi:hypothetical protein
MTKGRQPDYRVVQRDLPDKSIGWFSFVDVPRNDGLIGPFETEDEAIKDARETLGIVDEKKG